MQMHNLRAIIDKDPTMARPKVYCLYTGGTIGCAGSRKLPYFVLRIALLGVILRRTS